MKKLDKLFNRTKLQKISDLEKTIKQHDVSICAKNKKLNKYRTLLDLNEIELRKVKRNVKTQAERTAAELRKLKQYTKTQAKALTRAHVNVLRLTNLSTELKNKTNTLDQLVKVKDEELNNQTNKFNNLSNRYNNAQAELNDMHQIYEVQEQSLKSYYEKKLNDQHKEFCLYKAIAEDISSKDFYKDTYLKMVLSLVSASNISKNNKLISNTLNNLKTEYNNTKSAHNNLKVEYDNTKSERDDLKTEYADTKVEYDNTKSKHNDTKKELQILQERVTCGICMDKTLNSALGCGHMLCDVCLGNILDVDRKCPYCRDPINRAALVYL